MSRTTRVAISGIRGIPANFGGSETAVEEIGKRLAPDGFDITVYCRRHNSETDADTYLGMRRVLLPSLAASTSTRSATASSPHSTFCCAIAPT